jgi:putative ABC transport system permease protein
MNTFGYDYRFVVGNTDETQVSNTLDSITEIGHYEYWGLTSGKFLYQDGTVGNNFPIIAIPDDSKIVTPELIAGRWLEQNDTNSVVVGHKFLESYQDIDIGDSIKMDIAGIKLELHIVGILKDFSGTNIYMDKQFYKQNVALENSQDMLQVELNSSLKGRSMAELLQEIEETILNQGVSILQSETKADAIRILNSHHMTTFQTFLIVIFMILIVSSFGLASTTNIQTLERMKEIGIMKSMGADKKKIIKIITSESIFVGICGWVLSALLAIPGILIGLAYFGTSTLKAPIQCSGLAVVASYMIWLLLTLVIGKRASRRCALRAANMTIKDSLL